MANSSTLSFRVDDEIIDRLDDAANEADTSRSGLAREAMLAGLELLADPDTGEIDVPEHVAHDAKIKRMIARNKAERRKGKYRSEFNAQVKKSFSGENCEHPEEFRKSVSGYIEEAADLGEIPEGVADEIEREHGQRFDTYEQWVNWMVEDYYPAHYHAQRFDGQHTSDPLGNLTGISNATEWIDRAEKIAEAVERNDTKQALNIARFALQDDVVPENVREHAEDADTTQQGLIDAATSMFSDGTDTLTSGNGADNPELED